MPRDEQQLYERLADARGREVVFVSHCLLNENARYLGGAFHRGAVPEMIEMLRSGVGVYQMPCPEQQAWGGVLKRRMLRAYGLRDSALYRFRGALFRLFVSHTRVRYRRVAARVAARHRDYSRAGVRVLGVVGVGRIALVRRQHDARPPSLVRGSRGVPARHDRPQDRQRACRRRVPRGR